MGKYLTDTDFRLYADDTVFYRGLVNVNSDVASMNAAANQFSYWCENNRLTINLQKSKVMLFSNKKVREHHIIKQMIRVKIKDVILENVSVYKYLGVILDEHLTYIDHIKYLIGIISGKNYILKKIRPYLTIEIALLLVKTCILPFYDIGDVFYHSGQKSYLQKLQVLLNNSLRVVYLKQKGETGSVKTMHNDANLLLLEARRRLHLLKIAFKMHNFGCLNPLGVTDTTSGDNVTPRMKLRSSNQCRLPNDRVYNAKYENSFMIRCVKLWNCLDISLKQCNNINLFSLRVKREMMLSKINFPE